MNSFKFAVISDTHFGSEEQKTKELRDFIFRCYHKEGIRHIIHAGDVTDGRSIYAGHSDYLIAASIEEQAEIAASVLPELRGLRYSFITGNHDVNHKRFSGCSPGNSIIHAFRDVGRSDMKYIGSCYGEITIRDKLRLTVIHPDGGSSIACLTNYLSFKLDPKNMPHFLICGHFHDHISIQAGNTVAFTAGAFQGETLYIKRKPRLRSPVVGGVIVECTLNGDNIARHSLSFIRC